MSEAQSQKLRQCVFSLPFLFGNVLAVGFNIDEQTGSCMATTKAVSKAGVSFGNARM